MEAARSMGQSRKATSGDIVQLLSDICRQAGFRLTRQRMEVLSELAQSGDGATADKIGLRLRARLPTLSRETVRRILGELKRFGIVREIDDPDEVGRSSARTSSERVSAERKRAPRARVSSKRR